MMTKRVIILGAGGHGQVVADILWQQYQADGSLFPIGFLDDNPILWRKEFLGLPVLGGLQKLNQIDYDAVVIAIGNNSIRQLLANKLAMAGEQFVVARHPATVLAPDVEVEPGAMLCAGVIVNTGSRIGAHAILNTGCSVDHHCHIGKHVHIAPGVHLGGNVVVEDGAFVGIGASVIPQIRIGAWSTVGAGAVVINEIPSHVTVVGAPARPIKKRK